MGMDLTIMPLQFGDLKNNKWWLGYNRLAFDRDYELFNLFGLDWEGEGKKSLIKEFKIPDDVQVTLYDDSGCKETKDNPYGEPLIFFYAKDVKKIPLKKSFSTWNKAIIKFLKSLHPKTIVVLEWR